MNFKATLLLGGKTATGIKVPPEVIEALGSGKKPAVRVTIRSHTYRSTIAPRGGDFMLPVSAENRQAAGIKAGDAVDVEIELDTEKRSVTVPTDLAAALAADPKAKAQFDGLSFSRQQWFVLDVEGAKKPETRQRRVERAVAMLHAGGGSR
jgi:hypothetical protein